MDFEDYKYYPALRTRPAELLGYSKLTGANKDDLLPLITLSPWSSKSDLDESISQLDSTFDARSYILDISREPLHQVSSIHHLLSDDAHFSAWRDLITRLPNAIPIIQLTGGRLPRIIRQIQSFIDTGRRVAFRVSVPVQELPIVTVALATLRDLTQTIVFIDQGYIRDSFSAHAIAAAESINTLREDFPDLVIALLATSFPSSPLKHQDEDSSGRSGTIAMLERELHRSLGGDDVCIYGDYSSIHSKVYPGGGGRYNCRIDLPLDFEWKYERRTDCDSSGYIDCAQTLLKRFPSIRTQNCWGAQKIVAAAQGDIENMKSARPWIAARVNMHITRQLTLANEGAGHVDDDDYDE